MQTLLLYVAIATAIWSVGLAVFVVQADIAARRAALRLLTRSLFAILSARRAQERRERANTKGFEASI